MFIPDLHVARTVPQVHDHVLLGYRGTAETETGGSLQEAKGETGKLCEIKGARRQRQCSGLWYSWVKCVELEERA